MIAIKVNCVFVRQKLMIIMHEIVAGKKEVMDALGLDKITALDKGLSLIGVSNSLSYIICANNSYVALYVTDSSFCISSPLLRI